MKEIDDKVLADFFQKEKKEIADNGFSRRVMNSLPDREKRLSNIWAMFCTAIGIILFFLFNGLDAILNILREAFDGAMEKGLANIDIKSLAIAAIVLIALGIRKVATLSE